MKYFGYSLLLYWILYNGIYIDAIDYHELLMDVANISMNVEEGTIVVTSSLMDGCYPVKIKDGLVASFNQRADVPHKRTVTLGSLLISSSEKFSTTFPLKVVDILFYGNSK